MAFGDTNLFYIRLKAILRQLTEILLKKKDFFFY